MPTMSSGGITAFAPLDFKISDSTPGAILHPQPPPWDSDVRRGVPAVAFEGLGDTAAFMTNQKEG
ncbi:hypothetical protein SDC9_147738 [bioreactor metagenome]|uniref:Uncharacterized protein n=1 Tax=bioreactor metagenome TaxID=1076179 RepID=A0A645EIY6_9ZZZZ